jgi:hypothetical protein
VIFFLILPFFTTTILAAANITVPVMPPIRLAISNTIWTHNLLLQNRLLLFTKFTSLLSGRVWVIAIVWIMPWPTQMDIHILPALMASHGFDYTQARMPLEIF